MLLATIRSALVQVALTARDLAIFETLTQVRFLTATAIEWLHFPDRRPVWEADMQARLKSAEHPPYRVGRVVHRRIHLLASAGYLSRMVRPTAIRKHTWGGREPDLLSLTEDGALALAATTDEAHAAAESYRVRERSTFATQHTAEIGEVYAALRVKIATMPGMAMEDWQSDHLTARSYDHVTVVRQRAGGMERVSLPVVPDGTFVFVHPQGRLRVFIEVDRGTRRLETWREKIEAYQCLYRKCRTSGTVSDRHICVVDDSTHACPTTTADECDGSRVGPCEFTLFVYVAGGGASAADRW